MRILMMATYPWNIPRHGGQQRMYNIEKALTKAGHDVQSIGVLGSNHYGECDGFVNFPGLDAIEKVIPDLTLMEDWAIGELFSRNSSYFNELFSSVRSKPDVILIANPWLFAAARKFSQRFDTDKPKLWYDCQNIESTLKYEIVKRHLGINAAIDRKNKVLETEVFAIRNSDGLSCVAEEERPWIEQYSSLPVTLAKNGVSNRDINRDSLLSSNEFSSGRKFALYCGSSHPPNIEGFFEMFQEGMGCFAPDQRLVVAGGAGLAIKNAPKFSRIAGLSAIYIDAGEVTEDCLSGLLHTAHAIILPITHGGGTNLKSAEAIWAAKHVVATPVAMRGLEEFTTSPGVNVASNDQDFKRILRDVMLQPHLEVSSAEHVRRKAVLWENTLADLVEIVGDFEKVET